ncbi:MAG: 2-oxo acid dehydrogenase subunit E2 [Limnochordales bacterium]|nr:2-oxo acid dehydrogenase subunit E2 [Limnochordales bacterium]
MRWEFRLPDLGEGIYEAEVVSWLVRPGEEVTEDQIVAEIETDKAIAEIPSPVKGKVVELLAAEGAVVQVGQPLLVFEVESMPAALSSSSGSGGGAEAESMPLPGPQLEAEDESAPGPGPEPASEPRPPLDRAAFSLGPPVQPGPQLVTEPEAGQSEQQIASEQARSQAVPHVRRLARDLGVDITAVAGTGPAGRVTQPDVLRAASEAGRRPERVPLRGIRRATALNMARSFYTAPHAAVMDEVEVGELVRLREILLPRADARGVKLTYLPFIIMAAVRALKKHPYLNASLDDERQEIILHYEYNIGIATDTPGGLLVPVIKAADTLDLWGLAAEIERLASAARRQQLEHREMQNGTFTITNVGSLGGVWSVPIIRHPEVAILAVHRIRRRPVARGEQVAVGQMLNLVLTFDHRVVDGADALRFLRDLRLYLEHPALIFMPEL